MRIKPKQSLPTAVALGGIPILLISLLVGCGDQTLGEDPIPVLLDFPIAYVKRPIPVDDEGEAINIDSRRLEQFNVGGDLYLRERASPSATEINVTYSVTQGMGDVKDVSVSPDGDKLIFSLREPEIEDADDDEQPTWNIWQYTIESRSLERLISSDIGAEAGQDISPAYLPDGRIVFSSTRQRDAGAILLDEGKPKFAAQTETIREPAFVLHVMDEDGSNIQQISFNQSHDLNPIVSNDGHIIFSRWDNMGNRSDFNLYQINADGTGLEIIYGAHSHNTGDDNARVEFTQPRELPDGSLAVQLAPINGNNGAGKTVRIDIENYLDYQYAKRSISADEINNAHSDLIELAIRSDDEINADGYVRDVFPLWDDSDRSLISWSPCRLLETVSETEEIILPCSETNLARDELEAAPPLYGLYIYDTRDDSQLPIVAPEEGVIIEDIVSTDQRNSFFLPSTSQLDSSYIEEGVGVLHIRSVYDMDGQASANISALADPQQTTAEQRPARFLRIVKAVSIPDRDIIDVPNTAFGRSAQQRMREIIGYAPIEPDGSVMVKVPANVPLAISVLDADGRRTSQRHQNWLQVKPGETRQCNGCHDHNNGIPHGNDEGPVSVYAGAEQTGVAFTNTDPSIAPVVTETMAQTLARISCSTDCAYLTPSVDIQFQDSWTDENLRTKDASFDYLYADMSTPAPASANCQTSWTALCRTVIHYEEHIHPLWSAERNITDPISMVVEDRSCTSCHTSTDDASNPMVPAAQLDLSDGPSSDEPDHFRAYRDLLFTDNEQEIVDNTLQDVLVQQTDNNGNPVFQTDGEGNPILDTGGNPVPLLVTVTAAGPSMSANGANSSYFFDRFDSDGSHAGWLSKAELKLLAEWLDIGAQYYNNPFAVPQD